MYNTPTRFYMSNNEQIEEKLDMISNKITELNTLVQEVRTLLNASETIAEPDENNILAPALQDTYDILKEKKSISAFEVSLITGKSRPNENARLLQLVDLGYADRTTRGRRAFYHIKKN